MNNIIKKTNKAAKILKKYDQKGDANSDWDLISANIYKLFSNNKPIELLSFTCSTINPLFMFGPEPEKYVSLNPKGNNLENDLPLLKRLIINFNNNNVPLLLTIIIGNTDPYYIYTQEGKTTPYDKITFFKRYNSRWSRYKDNLNLWLKNKLPKNNYSTVSWYELEKDWEGKNCADFQKLFNLTRKNLAQYFSNKEILWEIRQLENAFGPGKYFGCLTKPNSKTLKVWVERKFAEYAVQGLWVKQIWPEGILIQNEKPTDLRYRMYQPLIKKVYKTRLPNIYPFGVDNLGFQ